MTQHSIKTLPRLGIGAMPFSQGGADTEAAAGVWHHAFDLGLTLINTADCYAPSGAEFGHNERLVGSAVSTYSGGRENLTVVTKIGITRDNDVWARDNSPEYLARAAENSAERLGFIPDVLCLHRLNREQSLPAAIEALCTIRDAGFAYEIGVSNVSAAEFDVAWNVSGGTIKVVENEQSPRYRGSTDVISACGERNVSFLAWSPLGGGQDARRLGELYPAFNEVAAQHGATANRLPWPGCYTSTQRLSQSPPSPKTPLPNPPREPFRSRSLRRRLIYSTAVQQAWALCFQIKHRNLRLS